MNAALGIRLDAEKLKAAVTPESKVAMTFPGGTHDLWTRLPGAADARQDVDRGGYRSHAAASTSGTSARVLRSRPAATRRSSPAAELITARDRRRAPLGTVRKGAAVRDALRNARRFLPRRPLPSPPRSTSRP